MQITLASESHIPEMHRIRLSVHENQLSDPARVQPQHYRALLARDGRGWIARFHNRMVGFGIADLRSSSIWALFVDPAFEGRGVGRRLHDAMLDWLFTEGAKQVWLTTDSGTRAERFYIARNWQQVGSEATGEVRYTMSRDQWFTR